MCSPEARRFPRSILCTRRALSLLPRAAALSGPQLRTVAAHCGRGGTILHAAPLQRAVDILHAAKEIGRRHAKLCQPRAIGAAANWRGDRLDAELATGLARQLDRAHVLFEPVAHVAILRGNVAGDAGAWLG